jgi:2-polyprenyl-6-methoxyphenol hydroxylase-like FAD-dependent oxidoreductase
MIVGGGIGGLCLAQGLRRGGVDVAVYERDAAPHSRAQGYRLNIEPPGSNALRSCLPPELWDRLVRTAGDPGMGMGVLDERLRVLMREDGIEEDAHSISRGTLREIMLTGLDDVVHFGKEFTSFERAGAQVTAHFADGSHATGDLLVGADGARSRVAAQLLPSARRIDVGAFGVGGRVALDTAPPILTTGKNMILPGRDFMFTAVFRRRESQGDDYLMWAYLTSAEVGGAAPAELVERRTRGWHPAIQQMIEDSEAIDRFDFAAAAPIRPWCSGNVTVLGDAVHLMPPVGGLGGNAALHDADLLRRAFIAEGLRALPSYETAMLRHGFAAVRQARNYTTLATSRSRTLRATARAFFRTCGTIGPLRRAVFG